MYGFLSVMRLRELGFLIRGGNTGHAFQSQTKRSSLLSKGGFGHLKFQAFNGGFQAILMLN